MGSSKSILGSKNPHWKGGRRIDKDGYILLYFPNHPHNSQGYVREHRLVMEKKIGRFLENNEVVHHRNGIKSDNDILNLELLEKKKHDILHLVETAAKRKAKRLILLEKAKKKCRNCGCIFFPRFPKERRIFCSLSCYKPVVIRKCLICLKTFKKKKSYCSRKCYSKARIGKKPVRKSYSGINNPNFRHGKYIKKETPP